MKIASFHIKQSRPVILLLLTTVFTMQQGYGQQRHELSAYVSGVFSSLDYNLNQGHRSRSDNFGGGVGYAYAFNERWSIGLGGELQSYNTKITFNNLEDSYPAVDMEGDEFRFNYGARKYEERQYVYYLNVPLTLTYQSKGDNVRFYATGGFKLGLPIHTEYSVKAEGLHTSGYYPQWDAVLESPLFMGFGDFGNQRTGRKQLDLDNSYSIMAETGIKHIINEKNALYVGVFVEYGLNTINDTGNNHLITYNTQSPADFTYNSVFTSSAKNTGQDYVDSVRTFAAGIKIRYALLW